MLQGDVGVLLGRGQAGVPQQFLNGAEIGAGIQEVGGERVAQPVGADAAGDGDLPEGCVQDPPHAAVGEAAAAVIKEESRRVGGPPEAVTDRQPFLEGRAGLGSQGDDAPIDVLGNVI